MSWVVAIDESGNLGKETRFFSMAALIMRRPRYLKKVYNSIPKKECESKFYNSSDEEIIEVLQSITQADVRIVYSSVDKYDHKGRFYGILGSVLYKSVLSELLGDVGSIIPNSDVELMVDRSRFITLDELRDIAASQFSAHGSQLKRCEKKNSDETPCIQIVDYVVGAIGHQLIHGDKTFTDIIQQKVVVARTD